jgi:hypothetical protein
VGLQIWLPDSANPKFQCRSCGKAFFEGEDRQFARHASACADANYGEAKAQTVAAKMPAVFGDETIDHELERYAKLHAEAILEGRKRLS